MPNFSLYEIDQLLIDAIEAQEKEAEANEGIYAEDWDSFLNDIQMERSKKLLDCARYIKTLAAMAEAIKTEKQALNDRQTALEAKAERIKSWVTKSMMENNDNEVQDANTKLSWRKSTKCIIMDEAKLDERFFKTVRSPMLTEIKSAIKSGETVDGAVLKETKSLQIK
jgi:type VI protein secretion system component VasK